MHLQILGSGSAGNALLIRAGELHLLLDAGLPLDVLEERLDAARVSPRKLDAIALTHGHLDHSRAAGRLARKADATVICCERVMRNRSVRKVRRLRTLPVSEPLEVSTASGGDTASLLAVRVPHDADPTVALRVEHRGRIACLITDLGSNTPDLARYLGDAHVIVLEFNHDLARLDASSYPDALKRRIRGPRGHLSNAQAADCLRGLVNPDLHTLFLAHLSQENNTPELALEAARGVLEEVGRTDVQTLVAAQELVGPNLAV